MQTLLRKPFIESEVSRHFNASPSFDFKVGKQELKFKYTAKQVLQAPGPALRVAVFLAGLFIGSAYFKVT